MSYYKINKSKLKKLKFKTNSLKFGKVGLKACNSGIITKKHLDAAKKILIKKIKKNGKLWIRIFLNLKLTVKSTGI